MQGIALFCLVASALVSVLAAQVPLGSSYPQQSGHNVVLADENSAEWNINEPPNPNDTDHLVFETVHSLLQHWPNTRMRNGHNIVPGVVPKGTLLYHGTNVTELPPGPDWLAIDPEHSYLFCNDGFLASHSQPGCWQLTLTTTRPLRVVYFDGNSAAKLPGGPLDAEDLLAWGEINPDNIYDEWQRVENLCEWGKKFDVDGFVRMEMNFEIILCDFSSGVSVVSWTNLVSWNPLPPIFPTFVPFEVMNSGSWHNRFPGETRIQLDLAGLVSFYDTRLVPSLVAIRAGQERWDHRVGNVSNEDLSAVKLQLEAALVRPEGLPSGIDWRALFQVILDRFAGRLEMARYFLNSSTTDPDEIVDLANKTHTQLRIMLMPYILLTTKPSSLSDKTDLDWTLSTYKLCATTHTTFLETQSDSMTDSEKLLLQAAKGTTREICRVVTKMWAVGVFAGLDPLLNTKDSLDIVEISRIRDQWSEDLERLMTWLDWSVWVKCNPDCSPEEMCYLPTWPVGFPAFPMPTSPPGPSDPGRQGRLTSFDLRTMAMERIVQESLKTIRADAEKWVRPEPRCIRRVDPYDLETVYDGAIYPKESLTDSLHLRYRG